MSEPLVSIIIPNWNGISFLGDCLLSLRKITYSNYKVLVVDNGSSDNSVEMIKAKFPEVIVLINKENLGFAAACNRGIKFSLEQEADFTLLLNNDTVVEPDFLDKMIMATDNKRVGIVGAKIYYFDEPKRIWFAGGRFIWWRSSGQHMFWGELDNERLAGIKDSDFITGCAMLIKKEIIYDIDYFFEPYFLSVEDLDFCYQAKKKGWLIKVALEAKIWHKVSFSRSGEFSFSNGYYGTRNRLYFAFKRAHNYLGGLTLLLIVVPIRLIQWLLQGKFKMVKGMILGIKDFSINKLDKRV